MRLLFVCLVICLLSCSTAIDKNNTLPVLSPTDYSSKHVELSDIIDTVKYIQLDNSMVLAGFGNVFYTERYIFGSSKYGILMYDSLGRFLRQIGSVGEGPEEHHRYYYKMAVDEVNEVVYVFMRPDILLSYSFAGDFLNRVHVQFPENMKGFYPSSIRVQNDLIFFYESQCYYTVNNKPIYWVAIKKDGSLAKYKTGSRDKLERGDEGVLYPIYCTNLDDSTMFYWNLYNDTVFHVRPFHEEATYLWKKGKFRLLETDSLRDPPEGRIRCLRIIETKAFLLLSWDYMARKVGIFYLFYDKKTGITYRLEDDMIYDKRADMSLRFNGFDYLRIGEHDYLLSQTKSYEVANIPNAIPWGIDSDDLEGNPVLVLIRLKDEL
ncbi:6-bladed beta-propeller [Bacteroides sp. UBA939]|uniref:6-bladed beta-propeller n=1 Tax=Bacteroides sp. UBA939 TaxID=1946092 RepID=UPI0025BCE661|nr:6-bladed beta-propeller [Bacteroides sp. UBA939]